MLYNATDMPTLSLKQEYASVNPEADNAAQVFRMTESNVHSQVPSASEVAILYFTN
jgi:hypothetical protein